MNREFNDTVDNRSAAVPLGIALQGGGSYGAFTKGALRALLESDIITQNKAEIKAVTGTSAGAVNGALLVHGLNSPGGPQQAIKNLDSLWKEVGAIGEATLRLSPVFNLVAQATWPNIPKTLLALGRSFLPSGYLTDNLKRLLEKHIPDWKPLQDGPVRLFVNATREDSKTKKRSHCVFSGKDISADTVTASGALQELGAHKIGNDRYFDGAYWRNPCFSDIKKENITDLLVITIQKHPDTLIKPAHQDTLRGKKSRPGHEVMTSEIHNHLAYINDNFRHLNLHVISMNVDKGWDETSRMNTDPKWLAELEKQGYQAGMEWIRKHGCKIGKMSSYSLPCYRDPNNDCKCSRGPK